MLFLAGYGSSGAAYFSLFSELHEHFEISIPDIIGFGSSGRPEFLCKNFDEAKEYLIVSLHNWMQKTGFEAKGPYTIMGHSLGCWIAANFAAQYPKNIEQLLFISPASMAQKAADFCPKKWINAKEGWG